MAPAGRCIILFLTSPATESKIFDPRDNSTDSGRAELLDATVVHSEDQWWMYVAGQAAGYGPTEIFSASLAPGAPLTATAGSPHAMRRVGWFRSENLWGPYTIGFLEWDGQNWTDRRAPAFVAGEEWERGSVYEPNLIYHHGKWKMWYVAGSNQADYLIQGYAESNDGWGKHAIFASPEMKMFDFCVRQRGDEFDAILARVWVKDGPPPPETGLWWCRAGEPSSTFSEWGQPIQILTAEDRGWHSGPWKPSLAFPEHGAERAFVFFDGLYRTSDPGPFPFAFTLGCLEVNLPLNNYV